MTEKFKEEIDIACSYQKAYSLILNHISYNERLPEKYEWSFAHGRADYSFTPRVTASFTAYVPNEKSRILLTITATENENQEWEISSSTKRKLSDFDEVLI